MCTNKKNADILSLLMTECQHYLCTLGMSIV